MHGRDDLRASMSVPAVAFGNKFRRTDSTDSSTSSLASFSQMFGLSRNNSKNKGPNPHGPLGIANSGHSPVTISHGHLANARHQASEAGDNGDLKGAVHEVPGLVPAPALNKQENTNGGALTVGTGAFVKYSLSKRSAEADAAILASSVSYVNPVSTVYHAAPYAYPYTYAGVHAPLLWG